MTEVVEKYIELACIIFLFVLSAFLTANLLWVASDPIINLGEDKTFQESAGVQTWDYHHIYGKDILLMLLNTDEMTPYPRAIKINDTPVIKLDNAFMATKMRNVSAIYSSSGNWKLSSMLNWEVISSDYVYEGADAPYIHYVLEAV